jgi:hypothetical protein
MVDGGCSFSSGSGNLWAVRWEELFEDLEGQLGAAAREEREAHVQELTRAELAAVRLASRLRSSGGRAVAVTLVDGTTLTGRLVAAADSWFELTEAVRRHVVPVAGVAWIDGLAHGSEPEDARRRLGLTHALRALARDRARVVVRTSAGTLAGRIERVGRDHLDLDTGAGGTAAGRTDPLAGRAVTVRLDAVLCVSEAA